MLLGFFFVPYCVIYHLVHVKALQSNRAQSQGQTQFLSLSLITPPELPEKSGLTPPFFSSTT